MPYTVATYSINVGTSQESQSKNSITDVLSVLLDNTSKEITPRDVRDAIFSSWESSVIRYSSNGTYPYIGIDRDDVKDIKLFLGKKSNSSSLIMTDDLINSDTDIFFYNLKSDSAVTQDLKIGFLAGASPSMYYTSPYLKSSYVSSNGGYISLDLVNPATYGTIGIQSGSSASITINNLTWPSRNYINTLVANPSSALSASASDLFLAVRAGGSIELLTYSSNGGILGSPGSPTTIYGSPVTVNGNSLEYTNLTPIVATFGGISIGSTFSNVSLIDMISAMLYPYLEPLSTITIDSVNYGSGNVPLSYNNTVERKHQPNSLPAITINYRFTLTKRTYNITANTITLRRSNPGGSVTSFLLLTGPTLSGSGLVTQEYTGYSVDINGSGIFSGDINDRNIYTFSCHVSDGTSSYTASTFFEAVYPYFYGFASTASITGANIATYQLGTDYSSGYIVKRIDKKTNQTLSVNSYALPNDEGYLHFMYPAAYGTLSSIQDGNGYVEYTHGASGIWTYDSTPISHPNGSSYWSSVPYYIYRKTILTSVPPSQNYKFNF
jgi:hypothetical protein